jgi:Mg2+/citrate symporter
MLDLFNRETQDALVKMIATQSDLIVLYKQASQEQKEITDHLKSIVKVQDLQISDLKLRISELKKKQ